MPKSRQKKYVYSPNGEIRELCPGIPLENAEIIVTDPKIIAEMDTESIRKSEIQRQNELEAIFWAKNHGCC